MDFDAYFDRYGEPHMDDIGRRIPWEQQPEPEPEQPDDRDVPVEYYRKALSERDEALALAHASTIPASCLCIRLGDVAERSVYGFGCPEHGLMYWQLSAVGEPLAGAPLWSVLPGYPDLTRGDPLVCQTCGKALGWCCGVDDPCNSVRVPTWALHQMQAMMGAFSMLLQQQRDFEDAKSEDPAWEHPDRHACRVCSEEFTGTGWDGERDLCWDCGAKQLRARVAAIERKLLHCRTAIVGLGCALNPHGGYAGWIGKLADRMGLDAEALEDPALLREEASEVIPDDPC